MILSGEFRFPAAVAVFWCLAGIGLDITAEGPAESDAQAIPAAVTEFPVSKAGLLPLPPVVPVQTIPNHGSSR